LETTILILLSKYVTVDHTIPPQKTLVPTADFYLNKKPTFTSYEAPVPLQVLFP